jgi:hypothetical protein
MVTMILFRRIVWTLSMQNYTLTIFRASPANTFPQSSIAISGAAKKSKSRMLFRTALDEPMLFGKVKSSAEERYFCRICPEFP